MHNGDHIMVIMVIMVIDENKKRFCGKLHDITHKLIKASF